MKENGAGDTEINVYVEVYADGMKLLPMLPPRTWNVI